MNIKYRQGITIPLSMNPLLKNYSETLLFVTLLRIYNLACAVCKQMELFPGF